MRPPCFPIAPEAPKQLFFNFLELVEAKAVSSFCDTESGEHHRAVQGLELSSRLRRT